MIINKPPLEVDVAVAQKQDGNFEVESALAQFVRTQWDRAKQAKVASGIDQRLLECERRRRGEYNPIKLNEINKTGGSDLWLMLTDIKCAAARSWILDVMQANDRMFDLQTSSNPDMPVEVKKGIVELVKIEAQQVAASGQQITPEAFRERMEQVHDELVQKMRDEASQAAMRMADTIQDSLDDGGFDKALEEFIDDFVTYPTAFMRGPIVRKQKRMTWGPNFQPIVLNDITREFERVHPLDVYPSPGSKGVNDGFFCIRHSLDTPRLEALRGTPGYNDDEINRALDTYGVSGIKEWLNTDAERDRLEGKDNRVYRDEIEAVEYMGPVRGEMLRGWGVKDRTIKDDSTYEASVWLVGPYCIKAVLNPDPLGRRNLHASSWRKIAGAIWGHALPEIMADVQDMANAAGRSLANNMAISSGPQVELTADRLAEGESVTSMYPWKIWQTTSDRTGGGQPGIRFFQPDMNAQELMGIIQTWMRQADEVTGIPNYTYGSTAAVGGAGRTASGLSMLMDNAAKGIKNSVLAIDSDVIDRVIEALYIHHMTFNPDPYIKGDFSIKTKGALGLIHKEQLQQRRMEFLQITANPIDQQIVGIGGRAYILRDIARGLQMDTDKIVPDEQTLAQKMAARMQMSNQPPPPNPLEIADKLADIEVKESTAAANYAKAGAPGIEAMQQLYGWGAMPPQQGGPGNATAAPPPQGNPGASVAPNPGVNAAPPGAVPPVSQPSV